MSSKIVKDSKISKNDNIISRDEHKLIFVPSWCIVLLLISILVTCIMIIMTCAFYIRGNIFAFRVSLGILCGLLLFGFICDFLEWHHNVSYVFSGNNLWTYTYNLDDNVTFYRSAVTVKVKRTESVRKFGRKLIVKGDIEIQSPMKSRKLRHKIKLCDIPEQHDVLMQKISSYICNKEVMQ